MRSAFNRLLARARAFFGSPALDRDFDAELQSHHAMLVDDNLRRGMPREQAERAARLTLGAPTQLRESHRDQRGLLTLETLLQDLRYTFRVLRRDAGFAIFAVLIVGLGIGASATIYSVVSALLLRPLPFDQPDRLAWIANTNPKDAGLSAATVPVMHYLDLRTQTTSFSDVAAYFAFYSPGDARLSGNGEPERLSGVPVSQNFFSVLGVGPSLGRAFTAEECVWAAPKVAILSDRLWRRRYASDLGILGRRILINDDPVTVVGVMPASFEFGTVFAPGTRIDVYFPFPLTKETNNWGNTLAMVGRLRPGVSLEQAQAEMGVLAPRIQRRDPDRTFALTLTHLEDHVSGRLRPALIVLAAAVGVVMLIVCANLSNLLMARMAAREREMAIRVALGAGRYRLVRQMLTESVVLSGLGAALGLAIAIGATRVLSHVDALSIPLLDRVEVDAGALVFTVLAAVLTGLFFGLVPALQVPSLTVRHALTEGARGSSRGRRHSWIRGSLVVAEISFACMLLVGAGLLARSLVRVLDVNLGFQPDRAAALRIDPGSGYSTLAERNTFYDEALRRVRAVPGMEAVGLGDALPFGRNRSWSAGAKGQAYSRESPPPEAFIRVVSDGYLTAMGISVRAGRDFNDHDTLASRKVVLINETLARTLWPGQDPIGRTVIYLDPEREVVGVVADVRHLTLEEPSGNEVYLPLRQTDDHFPVDLVMRTAVPPSALASEVREALRPISPDLPTNEFRTLQEMVDRTSSPRRFVVTVLLAFAAFALVLASLGIYAVISYTVNQRRQELGIRMALGASSRELQAGVLLQTLRLAAFGILIGLAGSLALARAISGLLFGVESTDPVTFVGMIAVLVTVAGLAGYLPARRASRVDPLVALRAE